MSVLRATLGQVVLGDAKILFLKFVHRVFSIHQIIVVFL